MVVSLWGLGGVESCRGEDGGLVLASGGLGSGIFELVLSLSGRELLLLQSICCILLLGLLVEAFVLVCRDGNWHGNMDGRYGVPSVDQGLEFLLCQRSLLGWRSLEDGSSQGVDGHLLGSRLAVLSLRGGLL